MSDAWSERLSEYLDDELDAAQRGALEGHLTACRACRDELEGLRRTICRLDTAPDREPADDLWPAIEENLAGAGPPLPGQTGGERRGVSPRDLHPGAPSRRRWPMAVAAGLALLVAGTWVVEWRGRSAERSAMVEPGAVEPGGAASVEAYLEAAAEWRRTLASARWQGGVEADLRTGVEDFERAVDETLEALREDPDDAELRSYLLQTLQAQARFLTRMGAAAEETS